MAAIPNFNVVTPDVLGGQERAATLSQMLSTNKLQQQLAPLQVQEQQQKVAQIEMQNELAKMQLQGQQGLTKWLTEGDTNDNIPADKFALNDRIATFVGVDPKDPIMGVVRSMAQHGVPAPVLMTEAKSMLERRNEYNKGTEEQQKIIKNNYDTWKDATAQLYNEKDSAKQSLMLTSMLPRLETATHLSPELDSMLNLLRTNPETGINVAYNLVAAQDKALGLSKAGSEAAKAGSEAITAAAKAPGGSQESPELQEMHDWLKQHPDKGPSDYEIAMKKIIPAFNFNLAGGGTGGFTPAALDQQAENYFQTGKLPAVGRGPAGIAFTRQIMQRANELHPNETLGSGSAAYAANKDALKQLQTNADKVEAFETTATKNLDLFLTQAQKAIDTGLPIANAPARTAARLLGSKDQTAFETSRQTAVNEISRVLNSANATGVVSDSARYEVESLISPDATVGQIMQAANILKQDMANRKQSYREQIADVQQRIGGKPSTSGGAAGGGKVLSPSEWLAQQKKP